jgi:hypothetical protein
MNSRFIGSSWIEYAAALLFLAPAVHYFATAIAGSVIAQLAVVHGLMR